MCVAWRAHARAHTHDTMPARAVAGRRRQRGSESVRASLGRSARSGRAPLLCVSFLTYYSRELACTPINLRLACRPSLLAGPLVGANLLFIVIEFLVG